MAATLGNGNITFGDSTTQSTAALPLTGGTLTGALEISSGTPYIKFTDTTASAHDYFAYVDSNNFFILTDRNNDGNSEAPYPLQLDSTNNIAYTFGNTILHSGNYNSYALPLTGGSLTGSLGVNVTSPGSYAGLASQGNAATSYASIAAMTNNNAQGLKSDLAFYSTFEGTADNAPRRSADIISGYNGGSWGNEYLAIHVGNNGAANDTKVITSEKLRITSNGNVGIGTTIPALGKLSILKSSTWNNEASAGISIISSDSNATASLSIGADNTNSVTYIQAVSKGTSYDYKLALNPNGGRVGIGTITPGYTLDVNGHARVNGSFYINAVEGNWGANYASTTANSFKSFFKGGSTSTIVGYIGSDGGGISSNGSGNNFGIRAEGELILMAGASDNTRITTSASIRNYRGAFATSSGTRYTLSTGSVGNINLVAASAAGASPTAANQYGITFQPNADNTQAGIIFSENSADGVGVGIFTSGEYTAGPKLSFAVSPQGYISSPRSPRFYAWANEYFPTIRSYTTEVTWYSGTSNGIYVPVNIGSCFNYTNGRFTAPTAGYYQFFGYFSRSEGNAAIDIFKNGGSSGCRALSYGWDWQTASVSNILYLAVGDYVHLSIGTTNSTVTKGYQVAFSGQLIG